MSLEYSRYLSLGSGPKTSRFHHFRKAENGVERRAQLMTHRCQKTAFCRVCFFGLTARLVRDCLGLFQLGNEDNLSRA